MNASFRHRADLMRSSSHRPTPTKRGPGAGFVADGLGHCAARPAGERRRLRDLHARRRRLRGHVEPGCKEREGLRAFGDHREAFLGVLHARGSRRGKAAADPRYGSTSRALRRRELARPQGRHALLGGRRHHGAAQRGRRGKGVREGDARSDGATPRRGGAEELGRAVSIPRRQPERPRDLHARSRRVRHVVEPGGRAHEGLPCQ